MAKQKVKLLNRYILDGKPYEIYNEKDNNVYDLDVTLLNKAEIQYKLVTDEKPATDKPLSDKSTLTSKP